MLISAIRVPAPALAGALLLGAAPPTGSLAELDRQFICPEAMRSDADRMAGLRGFFERYVAAVPNASPTDILAYRRLLLARHGCRKTLASVDAADRAVAAGDVRRQAWVTVTQRAGVELEMSTNHVGPVLDPRFPAEQAVDAYARLTLSAPAVTDATHTRYDQLVSHAVYFCRTQRYALVENDYFLEGRLAQKDPSPAVAHGPSGQPLYAIAPVPAGSVNADASRWACGTVRGGIG